MTRGAARADRIARDRELARTTGVEDAVRARSILSILTMTVTLGCGPADRPPPPSIPEPTPVAEPASPPPAVSSVTTRTIAGCENGFADAPALAETQLVWGPCTSSPDAGCRELDTASAMSVHVVASGTREGPMLFVRIVSTTGEEEYVLGPPDGPARVVLTTHCTSRASMGAMAIGLDGAALELHGPARESVFLAGPFAPDASWQTPAAAYGREEFGEVILGYPFAVAGRSIRAVDARQRIFRSSSSTSAFTAMPAHFRGTLGDAVAVGDATIAVVETIPETLVLQLGDAPPVAWYRPPRGGGVSAPAIDGDTAYLLVGSGRDRNNGYAAIDVYGAPIPTSTMPPVLQRVGATSAGSLHWMSNPVAGGGHVAWRAALDAEHAAIDVLDLVSSRRTRFVAPSSTGIANVLWVDDTELGVEVLHEDEAGSMTARSWIWRVTLAGLPDAS